MAFYAHPDVLDNGPQYIKDNCDSMVAVAAYTFDDSYSTVTGGSNVLATAAMTGTDFTLASAGNNRTLTTASGKQDVSADNTGAVSHFAFLDVGASKVLWVTEETTGQTITATNPVNFPQLVYTSEQPISA